ncbi:NmrA family NAD(P)-binding protein [Streptomyces sp. NPDC004779]|uniref:NmrA family NAD(P)-binding protein n=1 Tax=Streptomyces sp. NPDC056049 TaxID=3345693 RepID=UPI0035DC31A7
MKILVTGATGNVGRNIVEQLVAKGVEVRALTRNPATAGLPAQVEVVQGDLTDPASLASAFDGVDRLHLFPVPETVDQVVALAKRSGVRRIVDLSAAAITIGLYESPVEAAVEASGLEWTHVRPSEFMANLLPVWAPAVKADRRVRYPFADEAGVPVHEADIAAVAVAALTEDGHTGKSYTLTGPSSVTTRERVAAIAEALGEEVVYEEVTRERAREILHAQGGFAAENADFLLGFLDYTGGEGTGEGGVSEDDYSQLLKPWSGVEDATGRPARDYRQWALDHVQDFR